MGCGRCTGRSAVIRRSGIIRHMRVIAGTYRSRPLMAPRGQATRPTSDRLRETLFNVLAPRIPGARFADLYAGSGAVGIEALSRGASEAWFAERSAPAIAAICGNLKTLGIQGDFVVETGGTSACLRRMASSGLPFDIVFLDPPYEDMEEYRLTLSTLGGEAMPKLVAHYGIVIAEHARKDSLAESYGGLHRTRVLVQGDAALSFYSPRHEADSHAGSEPVAG